MNTSRFLTVLALTVTATLAACTVSRDEAPPLQGPSELGLSLTLFANPDVLSIDGASQSQIEVSAFNSNGQPASDRALRFEIVANGTFVDFGSLSARTRSTDSNGKARVTYTAPSPVALQGQQTIPSLSIRVSPGDGGDAANTIGRYVDIRLVPAGVITGSGPNPSFTVTPASPLAFTDVRFDGSASTSGLGAPIVQYAWNFGDGSTATGVIVTHRYASSSTFSASLTVTDGNGVSVSTSKDVVVGSGSVPTADFTFSPTNPALKEDINFNGSTSRAGAGHSIARYDWSFGSGSTQSGITVTKSYDVAGSYNVVLTVTDEVGQTAQVTKAVTVGGGEPSVVITASPGSPHPGDRVQFNSDGTTYSSGAGPVSFSWTFGDGGSCSTASPAGCGVGGTPANPTHTYAGLGSYSARLSVTDTMGRTGTNAITVTVVAVTPPTPPVPPVASFTFGPNNVKASVPGPAGAVTFDGRGSSGANPLLYSWNFGDGVITPNSPSAVFSGKTYVTAGTYSATLTVTDSVTLATNTSAAQTVTVIP